MILFFDEWQWVSEVPVKPIEIVEISVKDYWHTIIFSDEARDIQRELYGLNLRKSIPKDKPMG